MLKCKKKLHPFILQMLNSMKIFNLQRLNQISLHLKMVSTQITLELVFMSYYHLISGLIMLHQLFAVYFTKFGKHYTAYDISMMVQHILLECAMFC